MDLTNWLSNNWDTTELYQQHFAGIVLSTSWKCLEKKERRAFNFIFNSWCLDLRELRIVIQFLRKKCICLKYGKVLNIFFHKLLESKVDFYVWGLFNTGKIARTDLKANHDPVQKKKRNSEAMTLNSGSPKYHAVTPSVKDWEALWVYVLADNTCRVCLEQKDWLYLSRRTEVFR